MPRMTNSLVAGSRSARKVGSASASFVSSGISFASSARFLGSTPSVTMGSGNGIGS